MKKPLLVLDQNVRCRQEKVTLGAARQPIGTIVRYVFDFFLSFFRWLGGVFNMRLKTPSRDLSCLEPVMPNPLPVGKSVTSGPNIVLQRPQLAAAIGNVCANWTLIDNDIMRLYALLMGTYITLPQTMPNEAPPTHPVAYQVFDTLNTLNQRLGLLSRLGKWNATPEESEKLEKLLDRIRKKGRERNKIAHGLWGICKDYPDDLILVPVFGDKQIYTQTDLDGVSQRIIELHSDFGKFTVQIYERLR